MTPAVPPQRSRCLPTSCAARVPRSGCLHTCIAYQSSCDTRRVTLANLFPTAPYESNKTRIGLTCRPLGHPAQVPCVDVEHFAVVAQA